jgi:alpha-N-acetylgalactosaminidase
MMNEIEKISFTKFRAHRRPMLSLLIISTFSLDNGLALTPPMGWMTWEQFHCLTDCSSDPDNCISEQLVLDTARALASSGYRDAGYTYVNIDDCWSGIGRDSDGKLYPNADRFPHGIPWLAEQVHALGLRLGIYADYGTETCGGYTGSEGYLLRDAATFASWGVDMLKLDGCYSQLLDMADAYPGMSRFLNATGRPILFSCSWPAYDSTMDYAQLPPFCNMWRNWGDISCNWGTVRLIIDKWGNMTDWVQWAGPGHWNDPDQLMIGMRPNRWVEGLSIEESRTQFALWAILAAPLFMSADMRTVPDSAKEILLNGDIIAVNQDPLGKQGTRITPWGNDATVWVRPLDGDDFALALFNRGEEVANIVARFSTFTTVSTFRITDLYAHQDLGTFTGSYTAANVSPHDTVMLRLRPVQ